MMSKCDFADGALKATALEKKGTLEIDRPNRKNAINRLMWRELPLAIEWLTGQPDMRCLIIRGGGGKDFSAGADISEFDSFRAEPHSALNYEASNSAAFQAVRRSPVPVISMIRGICFGGAFGLAAATDFRLATANALFAVPAGRLGLAYPVDAMRDIVNEAGLQMARTLLFTGTRKTAREMSEAGFVYRLCDDDELETETHRLADDICANAPLSNRASKAAILAAQSHRSEDRALAVELAESTFTSADYAEGRRAFAEKRRPVFSGN